MADFDPRELAIRVQGLLQARFKGDLRAAARELKVDPEELGRIVEDETEYPRLDVLSALVRYFGVDACWLVTGEYDWRAHLRLLEEEEGDSTSDTKQLLLRLTTRRGDEIGRPIPASDLDRLWTRRSAPEPPERSRRSSGR